MIFNDDAKWCTTLLFCTVVHGCTIINPMKFTMAIIYEYDYIYYGL